MPQRQSSSRPLRVVYIAGPGDAPDVLRRRAAGDEFADVAHLPYSGQLFDACEELDAQVLSVSWHKRADDFTHRGIRAINRPNHLGGRRGIPYQLGQLQFTWDIVRDIWNAKADVLITSTEPHAFYLEPLIAAGVKVVTALHATVLPVYQPPRRLQKLTVEMSRHFYQQTAAAILSHPGPCTTQIVELTQGRHRPIVEFLPLYRPGLFDGIPAPRRNPGEKFRVIQVGRLEANKGVFDLIEVARRAKHDGRNDLHFDVCGTGSALEDARNKVRELGLQDSVILHGWTELPKLRELWGLSHAALVPTTTDFVEGFNQVIVEALLAGRPIITSPVCPSLDFATRSAIAVPPNDVGAYHRAVLQLADDAALYASLQKECAAQAQVFLDPSKSFGAAIKHVLTAIMDGREITSVWNGPTPR